MAAHRGNRGRALLSLAIVCLLTAGMASANADSPVRMAGSFNGWSASDPAFQLSKIGKRFELSRYWRCGVYEFKFVFDGSWKHHLGDAGDDRLAQPGQNIHLSIGESGEYVIWLDVKRKQWGFDHVAPTRPHAIAVLRRLSHDKFLLDASASLARSGHPIRIHWEVRAPKLVAHEWQFEQVGGQDILDVFKPGHFAITLHVDDGEMRDQTMIHTSLGGGFDLEVRSLSNPGGLRMYREGDHVWAAVYQAPVEGVEQFLVKGNKLPKKMLAFARGVQAGRRYLVEFNDADRTLQLLTEGWQEFNLIVHEEPRLSKDLHIERIEVVGDFNGWHAGRTPMAKIDQGHYQTILKLPDGIYHYKFLINGSLYLEDRNADAQYQQADGVGGQNSGFRIGPDAASLGPAKPDDIVLMALKHDPLLKTYFTPLGDDVVRLTLRTLAGDISRAFVLSDSQDHRIPMRRLESRNGFDYWIAQIRTKDAAIRYAFLIEDGARRLVYNSRGVDSSIDEKDRWFEQEVRMTFEPPAWARQAVWYQIFPERFRNGDPRNDPPRTVPWSQHWYQPYQPVKNVKKRSALDFAEKGAFNHYIYDRRYGGDLQGVREKLPYLRRLGVNAIYLNPIFLAESLHKYDTSDYRHIDDHFGVRGSLKKIKSETRDPATWQWSDSDRVFLDLLKEAHRLGFRIIIDGVFNHVGRDFWAFQDVLRKGRKSAYADWFDITSWEPFHYRAWDKDDGSLPRLKHDESLGLSRPVREHLFAVTRRWMDPDGDGDPSDGIDGWRLDVASDINEHFWIDWRKLVKSINPEALIVAELWTESSRWLNGQTFDAVMNYPFAEGCQRFFVNRKKRDSPKQFDRRLHTMLGWYPPQVNYVLQNLFDSHDTDRAASMFMNPDLPYDKANRLQDNGPRYNPAKPTPDCYQRLKLMVTFQMTFLGAPMIYYGDEVGMYGADDPSCRKPMLWDDLPPNHDPDERIETDVYDHYRRMIAIRQTYPALRLGLFETLQADSRRGIYAFARTLGNQSIVVVLNNSDQSRRLNTPVPWPDSSRIVRLDDPAACEGIIPPAAESAARPTVRPVEDVHSKYHVVDGRLSGGMLDAHTGGVFYGDSVAEEN